jgi:S-adenosylmethionine:tRNA ribosyltransferase-isomerase
LHQSYQLEEYLFHLPPELIAQEPPPSRGESRLLVGCQHEFKDAMFSSLTEELRGGDLVVFNDTRVMNARTFPIKESTGATIECFFTSPQLKEGCVEALIKPAKRLRPGDRLRWQQSQLGATVVRKTDQGLISMSLESQEHLDQIMAKDGETPLPPYIKRTAGPTPMDAERYQTVFARHPGAVAAPTAGLHFSQELLEKMTGKGIETATVTHHVGLGTFKPIQCQDIRAHHMEEEPFFISEETANLINQAKREKRRVIAVGTTVTRCLESAWTPEGIPSGRGHTDLYIYPPYPFQAIDGLLTNFHLPGSTLILLVSAFFGKEHIRGLYQHAITQRYRFYSYGDAMLLWPPSTILP